MGESNEVILLRYYHKEQELDVFLNGEDIQTFSCSTPLAKKIVDMLEKLGHHSFEKQQYQKR
ncbi:MAG: hypothetical protein WD512_07010 [Candidatus Paceibacterota bacterium]